MYYFWEIFTTLGWSLRNSVHFQIDRSACCEIDDKLNGDIPIYPRIEWIKQCRNGDFGSTMQVISFFHLIAMEVLFIKFFFSRMIFPNTSLGNLFLNKRLNQSYLWIVEKYLYIKKLIQYESVDVDFSSRYRCNPSS